MVVAPSRCLHSALVAARNCCSKSCVLRLATVHAVTADGITGWAAGLATLGSEGLLVIQP